MKDKSSIEEKTEAFNKANISSSIYDGLKTEMTASMIMSPPNDEFKKGWNEAMKKALGIVSRYKEGKGLFQQ